MTTRTQGTIQFAIMTEEDTPEEFALEELTGPWVQIGWNETHGHQPALLLPDAGQARVTWDFLMMATP